MKMLSALTSLLAASLLAGCNLPGKPKAGPEVPRPEAVLSFEPLYAQNCAGCHGAAGREGAATDLANPEYMALIDDDSLRDIIGNGEKGVLMPGFGVQAGGDLTDAQINVIVSGMRARWAKPNAFGGANPPPYRAAHAGDPGKGAAVYTAACAQCHGATGQTPGPAGPILEGSFLALINEQTVRTTIVAGRPDIGQPDFRNMIPGRALTDDEITDVSAWLIAQTPPHPGHPYPNQQPTSEYPGEAQPSAIRKTVK